MSAVNNALAVVSAAFTVGFITHWLISTVYHHRPKGH